jgi:Fe-S-cluster containining protein
MRNPVAIINARSSLALLAKRETSEFRLLVSPIEIANTMNRTNRVVNCSAKEFIEAWWRGDAGPVACGRCSACCYYDGIPVDKQRDRQRLPHLLTEQNADGDVVLRRRADGACVHLGEHGCTVYEHRPTICRSFDCRAFAAMGIVEHCGPGQQTPDWEFAEDERARF